MDDLHKYVPSQESTQNMELHDGGSIQFTDSVLCELLFGGDQLTVARARSGVAIRANHETSLEKLQGLIPVTEDWHTRMTLLKV